MKLYIDWEVVFMIGVILMMSFLYPLVPIIALFIGAITLNEYIIICIISFCFGTVGFIITLISLIMEKK